MKRVSIITILDNTNFGTYLQAFALCKTIDKLGGKPQLVNYWRCFMLPRNMLINSLKSCGLKLYKWPMHIWRIIKYSELQKKNHQFIERYLTPIKYRSFEELIKKLPQADIYMTGSDQVWNSVYNRGIDKSFYLDFAPENSIKCAYAASIGMSDFSENEKDEVFSLLCNYSKISVRENSAKDILIRLGIDRNKLFSVLDPTLLLDKQDWFKIIPQRIHQFKYLLLYSVESKQRGNVISELAKKIAKDRGLKIVGVYYGNSYWKFECSEIDHYYADPLTFLSLMYYADFTVVSSFHGTAFSINFQKEFISVSPERFNSRVMDLLSLTGLSDRLVCNIDVDYKKIKQIDYSSVDEKLKSKRKESMNFINGILND